jgi:hypothetical protein
MIHLIFAPVVVVVVLALVFVRLVTAPFRYSRWHRRHHGYGYGWGGGWGGYGYRPRMPILTILAVVALERMFGRRY